MHFFNQIIAKDQPQCRTSNLNLGIFLQPDIAIENICWSMYFLFEFRMINNVITRKTMKNFSGLLQESNL